MSFFRSSFVKSLSYFEFLPFRLVVGNKEVFDIIHQVFVQIAKGLDRAVGPRFFFYRQETVVSIRLSLEVPFESPYIRR